MTGLQVKNGNGLTWLEEEDNLIKELYGLGVRTSEIAKRLNGRTKNAVIGRIHRMGISGGRPAKPPKPKRKPMNRSHPFRHRPPAPAPQPQVIELPPLPPPPPVGLGISLTELRSGLCKDVMSLSGGDDGLATYCGTETPEGKSFCQYHASIYYLPPKRR